MAPKSRGPGIEWEKAALRRLQSLFFAPELAKHMHYADFWMRMRIDPPVWACRGEAFAAANVYYYIRAESHETGGPSTEDRIGPRT